MRGAETHALGCRSADGIQRALGVLVGVPQFDHGGALLQHRQQLPLTVPAQLQTFAVQSGGGWGRG